MSLVAPELLDYEIVSVLRGLTLAEQLSVARAQDLLTDVDDLPGSERRQSTVIARAPLERRYRSANASYGCSIESAIIRRKPAAVPPSQTR